MMCMMLATCANRCSHRVRERLSRNRGYKMRRLPSVRCLPRDGAVSPIRGRPGKIRSILTASDFKVGLTTSRKVLSRFISQGLTRHETTPTLRGSSGQVGRTLTTAKGKMTILNPPEVLAICERNYGQQRKSQWSAFFRPEPRVCGCHKIFPMPSSLYLCPRF